MTDLEYLKREEIYIENLSNRAKLFSKGILKRSKTEVKGVENEIGFRGLDKMNSFETPLIVERDAKMSGEMITNNDNELKKKSAIISKSYGALLKEILLRAREPISKYQANKGLDKSTYLNFTDLLHTLYQNVYTSFCAITLMIYQLMPLLDSFLFVVRFVIDALLDILATENRPDYYLKLLTFCSQIIIVVILMVLLWTVIIVPLVFLGMHVLKKIFVVILG